MSYILDALRRADAERQRGAVPGLHDPPLHRALTDAVALPATRGRRLGQAGLVLVVLGLAGAAGWLLRPQAPALAPMLAEAPATAPLPAPSLAPPPAPALARQPAPALGPPAAAPPPLVRPSAPRRPAPVAASAPAASASIGPAAPARLPLLAELPEAQRRDLGPLVVGGAMHAEQAALRIVILNGQVVHEGDRLGPELQVQQIRLKSVVLSHRGQRFELPF